MNEVPGQECPGPPPPTPKKAHGLAVGEPSAVNGLGFHQWRWNMGWMHTYSAPHGTRPAAHRRYHHNQLTFGLFHALH